MGASPSYAAQVASMLDNMNGALPLGDDPDQPMVNPPVVSPKPAPPPGGKPNGGGNKGNTKGDESNTKEIPNKKARTAKPQAPCEASQCCT